MRRGRRPRPTVLGFVRTTPGHGLSAVSYYRAGMPLRALGERSGLFDVAIMDQSEVSELIQTYGPKADEMLTGRDIYVISRLYRSKGLREFVGAIHEAGGRIVFDTDDDLTEEHRHLDGRGGEFIETMKAVDLVTVSTPYLARRLEGYLGYKPPVLANHIDVDWFAEKSLGTERKIPGLTIGFIGTASHYNDWRYPMDALARVARENREVSLVAAGYFPDYLKDLPNAFELRAVPYGEYPGMMKQFDIVCCSLDPDDAFNGSKSAVKALEAMSAARRLPCGSVGGAVPVCTDMPVYRRAVNVKNGLLVGNGEWYEALSRLVEDSVSRRKLSIAGYKWVAKNRNIKTGYRHWGQVYRRLLKNGK